jgi:hypothetical protein
VALTRHFCQQTQINLAGFDLIFDESGRIKKGAATAFSGDQLLFRQNRPGGIRAVLCDAAG